MTTTLNDPFARLPKRPEFTLTSSSVPADGVFALAQMSGIMDVDGGQDRSPQLTWSGAPEQTSSFMLTVYDPDAPSGSGFWHWVVTDIPADVTELPEGAGAPDSDSLPKGARQFRNDAGSQQFLGAAPPEGHGPHRYFIVVSALDVERLDVPDDASPALVGFTASDHVLARAVLVATAEL